MPLFPKIYVYPLSRKDNRNLFEKKNNFMCHVTNDHNYSGTRCTSCLPSGLAMHFEEKATGEQRDVPACLYVPLFPVTIQINHSLCYYTAGLAISLG